MWQTSQEQERALFVHIRREIVHAEQATLSDGGGESIIKKFDIIENYILI